MPKPAPRPLFHGLTRQIRAKIEAGEFEAGDRLPSERWFGEAFGVSRTTVRRAINELVTVGTIESRGRALYVAKDGRAVEQNVLMSMTEMARSRGLTPSARVLASTVRPATLDEADTFVVAPGADVFDLTRLRLIDGAAIAVDYDTLPLNVLPKAREIDFRTASLFASMAEAGCAPVEARMQIEARMPTGTEARLLKLPNDTPVLVASEQATAHSGRVVIVGRTVYRSDRHRFLATFTRSARPRTP
jgi:GntR family transcriptional regulator